MNPRERVLAIAVAALLTCVFGFLGFSYVQGQFNARRGEMARLEGDIRKFKQQDVAAKLALQRIVQFEDRSLPSNVEIARTQYQDWLLNQVQSAGMTKPEVTFKTRVPDADLLDRLSFTVSAKGTAPQIIDFLHAFYAVDWLHRVTRLSLHPIKDEKALTVTIDIEALSMRKARAASQLVHRPSKRLALSDKNAYHQSVAHRNFFGPLNNPPRITSVSGSKDVYLGRTAELTVKGADPDPLDKLRYKLVQSPSPDAKIDEEQGRISWSPKEPGKYEFIVEAFDDGLPSLASSRETIVVNVTHQPPAVARLDFDEAKYTSLSAVLDIDGKGEIWLDNRPAGKTLVLHEGDQFEVGSVKGTVTHIGENDFSFRAGGKLHRLRNGDALDKAMVIEEAAAANPASDAVPASATKGVETPMGTKDRAG
jgi:hypothetical protein